MRGSLWKIPIGSVTTELTTVPQGTTRGASFAKAPGNHRGQRQRNGVGWGPSTIRVRRSKPGTRLDTGLTGAIAVETIRVSCPVGFRPRAPQNIFTARSRGWRPTGIRVMSPPGGDE